MWRIIFYQLIKFLDPFWSFNHNKITYSLKMQNIRMFRQKCNVHVSGSAWQWKFGNIIKQLGNTNLTVLNRNAVETRNDDSPESFYSIITFWNVCKGIASFDWHKANMKFYYMILYHFNSQRDFALYCWYQLFSVSPRKKHIYILHNLSNWCWWWRKWRSSWHVDQ